MDNNYFNEVNTITASSDDGLPVANAYSEQRSEYWTPSGNFTVNDDNNKLYINDGADKTVTLTNASYTGSTLRAHIQTKLNASSSSWVVTRTANKFTISRSSGTAILRFSQTTDAAWGMLGFTGTADDSSGSWTGALRLHTDEWVMTDCSMPMEATFVGVIGPIDRAFIVSPNGTVKVQANNVDVWDDPPLDLEMEISDRGAFLFMDDLDEADRIYRYWRVQIIEPMNPILNTTTSPGIGYVYIGDYQTVTATNIARGFTKTTADPTRKERTESGAQYAVTRPKYRQFDSLEIQNLSGDEHRALEQLFFDLGVGTAFFVSLDPLVEVSATLDELTLYGFFDEAPTLTHLHLDYYQMGFALREAV